VRGSAKQRLLPALAAGPAALLLVGGAAALGPVGAALAASALVAIELWSGAAWLGLPLGRRALRRSWGAAAAGRLTLGIGAAGLAARLRGLRLPGGPVEEALWMDAAAVDGLQIGAGVLLGAVAGAGVAAVTGHGRALLGWALPLGLGLGALAARVQAGGPGAATAAEVEASGAAVLAGAPSPRVGDWIAICADPRGGRPVAFARWPGLALRPARGGAGAAVAALDGLSAAACGPPGAAHAVARGDRAVWLLDAATLSPLRRLDHPGQGLPGALLVLADGALVVADDRDGSLRRYAPGAPTGSPPVAEHRLDAPATELREDPAGGPLLAISGAGGSRGALPLDPATLRPRGPPLPLSDGPVALGGGWLWDLAPDGGLRGRAWPGGQGAVRRADGGRVHGLAVDGAGRVWALDRAAGRLSAVDPGGPTAEPGPRVGAAGQLASAAGDIYAASLTGLIQITVGATPARADPPRSPAQRPTP
jgi:hypothetical protein